MSEPLDKIENLERTRAALDRKMRILQRDLIETIRQRDAITRQICFLYDRLADDLSEARNRRYQPITLSQTFISMDIQ